MRAQSAVGVAEEIFPHLCLTVLALELRVSVDAAAGFVEFEDRDGFVCAGVLAVEAPEHIAVETFGTEDYEDVDCEGKKGLSEIMGCRHRWC